MAQHDDKEAKRLQRELAKYAAIDEQDVNEFISLALADRKGQKFLWWLLQVGKFGDSLFAADAIKLAFQGGEMNVGMQIFARILEVNPMGFAQLQIERKTEDDRRNLAASRIAAGRDLFANDADDTPGGDDSSDD